MGATKRMSNGEAKLIGPHPSVIHVAAQYMSHEAIEKKLFAHIVDNPQDRSSAEAREDSIRLQGVTWIDQTRRALSLPIRTYTTACSYYHHFRLANPGVADQAWADTAAAALLLACKAEDTLKKSRDILAAAYNLKTHDNLSSDDVVFDMPSKAVIGLERMMLEASGFDFRAKYPHDFMTKLGKSLAQTNVDPEGTRSVARLAWTVLTDLYRTFAPLKQTTQTMALAALELAAQLTAATSDSGECAIRDQIHSFNYQKANTSRGEVMETLLDLLDLYTHHTAGSILGTKYSLEHFLRIRLGLNKESEENALLRHTQAKGKVENGEQGPTLKVANGHPTPVSPPQAGTQAQQQPAAGLQYPPVPEGGGTLRFMLNPQLVAEEKTEVQKYFKEEWEEYDEEIEVPLPRTRSKSRDLASNRDRDRDRDDRTKDRATDRERDRMPERERDRARDREPERARDRARDSGRERDWERENGRHDARPSGRDRERDREWRYDDRRYEDDRYDRRDGRRYDEYDRRRDRR
ncbi:hypothetical protein BAUCODRAFT_34201 [Baudoinia panamericana UAMH 10762]|uniref:RNA polymerase II holoenzyme cyclin-like subunit n=1 Tax=Baudoinia panamericana (strain UAMH 10762) TaxID=717646 RepID=M2MYX1_BAUPA|nr:uncharacterized protein BAUCODRAFT_34201 [Baudoinia panamericana UAMH 10762]EMC96808.1 hypothetical protein BAUCODRAFT_34201 [Baudoinia panamericana UAMH 10762]